MLTSLLSLYIASSLDLNLANNLVVNEVVPNIESKIASFSLASLDQNNFTPIKNPRYISPIIDARSSIVVDLSTGKILYEKNKHQRLAIASITKLMTALIILEENNLDEITIVSTNAANTEGSTMHLRIGEEISIDPSDFVRFLASSIVKDCKLLSSIKGFSHEGHCNSFSPSRIALCSYLLLSTTLLLCCPASSSSLHL